MFKLSWVWFHRLASPPYFYQLAGQLSALVGGLAAACITAGLYGGLWYAPADYQQGDGFRIIYIHVPSAWLSMSCYAVVALSAGVGLVWRHEARARSRGRGSAHWRVFHIPRARHRLPLGQTNVGHLLGMGCATHFAN